MGFDELSPSLVIIMVVGLALAPFVAVMVTAFTKIVVVLSLLRNALGLQQVPPNVVINGLAIILSIYVMYPVVLESQDIIKEQSQLLPEHTSGLDRLMHLTEHGREPLRDFLIKHSGDTQREFFHQTAIRMLPDARKNDLSARDFIVVIPAFTVSELTAAFQIGFLIFLPFLVIDLIVSNILLALGMMMMPPSMVSLPFKLLLFVFVSGWTNLVHGLVMTYL